MNTTITEQDFINEIQNNPNSNSILIFADFSEENGDSRCELLRKIINSPERLEEYCPNSKDTMPKFLTKQKFLEMSIESFKIIFPDLEEDSIFKYVIRNLNSRHYDDLFYAVYTRFNVDVSINTPIVGDLVVSLLELIVYCDQNISSAKYNFRYYLNEAIEIADKNAPFNLWYFTRAMEYKHFNEVPFISPVYYDKLSHISRSPKILEAIQKFYNF